MAALVAFVAAGALAPAERAAETCWFVLALGLFALSIASHVVGLAKWQGWWNFAFGFAFLLLAIAATSKAPSRGPRHA